MNTIGLYLIQLSTTLLIAAGLAAYLRPTLRRVLLDLCGTEERAQFWTSFSNIMLVALPVIFGMGFAPEQAAFEQSFFAMTDQIRWNLLGFILSLVAIGGAVSFFALVAPRSSKTN
jgi:hypothetical protein